MDLVGLRVKHAKWGAGVVIEQGESYITVEFASETKPFIYPSAFEGFLKVEDPANQQIIDDAIHEAKAAAEAKRMAAPVKTKVTPAGSKTKSSKKPAKVAIKHAIEQDFETYLIKSGYKEETASGLPSTVYSYINAVGVVLAEEGLSWAALASQIASVIALYDVGGSKEAIGSKSNQTVINALRRFKDFVEHSGFTASGGSGTP